MHALKSWNVYFLHWLLVLLTCVWYSTFSLSVSLSYTTSLILQAHARQLCQSSMLKLALFPGSHSAFCWYYQWQKEGYHSTCLYTSHSFTSKHKHQVKKLTTHKPFPNCVCVCVFVGWGGTPLKTPGDKLYTLNLGSFPCLPRLLFFGFAFSRSIIHWSPGFRVLYCSQTEEQKWEALGMRLQQTFL